MRGIERSVERTAGGEAWSAHVETGDGSVCVLSKDEYELRGLSPDFWSLRKQRANYSAVVAAAMTRVVGDFSMMLAPAGYEKVGARRWARITPGGIAEIAIERAGSSYGAPYSASVTLRVWISVSEADAPKKKSASLRCEMVRRPDGSAYHHRFNAETFSTYDRCLEELGLFVSEFAEPWFRAHLPSAAA